MKFILLIISLFSTQEGAKSSDGVIMDYDKFIIQKINEFPVTFRLLQRFQLTKIIVILLYRPKSGADDRILQINLDGTQGIRHVKAKVQNNFVFIFSFTTFVSFVRPWRYQAQPMSTFLNALAQKGQLPIL